MRPVMLLVFTACALVAADGATLACKPVEVTSWADFPGSEIWFGKRARGHGVEITYLVEADILMGFKDDSLAITAITTADGKNLATSIKGRPTWKQGSYDNPTMHKKFGTFTIAVSENVMGKTDGLNVSGSIVALIGKRDTKKIAFNLSEAKAEIIDGLRISLGGTDTMVEAMARMEKRAKIGPLFGVTIAGEVNKVLNVVLRNGVTGEAYRENQQIHGGKGLHPKYTERTWFFSKPTVDEVTVELTYWNTLEEVTIPIGAK